MPANAPASGRPGFVEHLDEVRPARDLARHSPRVFFMRLPARVSSDKPRLKAFCRVAFSVLFKARAILAADVFLRARAFNLRICSARHARLFARLLTIGRPQKSERPACVSMATCQRAQDQFAVVLTSADRLVSDMQRH